MNKFQKLRQLVAPKFSAQKIINLYHQKNRTNDKGKVVHRFKISQDQFKKITQNCIIDADFLKSLNESLIKKNLILIEGPLWWYVASTKWLDKSFLALDDEDIVPLVGKKENKKTPTPNQSEEYGMSFQQIYKKYDGKIRYVQRVHGAAPWPSDQPKAGTWVLTESRYTDDRRTTFIEFDDDHLVCQVMIVGHD